MTTELAHDSETRVVVTDGNATSVPALVHTAAVAAFPRICSLSVCGSAECTQIRDEFSLPSFFFSCGRLLSIPGHTPTSR